MEICEQIIKNANELARKFYRSYGNNVKKGYRFDIAKHPQEKGMWNLAVLAYDFIEGIDIEDVLEEVECITKR